MLKVEDSINTPLKINNATSNIPTEVQRAERKGFQLFVGIVIYRIFHLDDVNGCFKAAFRLHLKWECSVVKVGEDSRSIFPSEDWRPEISFPTALSTMDITDKSEPEFPSSYVAKPIGATFTVSRSERYLGTFAMERDYSKFPFDQSDLEVAIRIARVSRNGIRLVVADSQYCSTIDKIIPNGTAGLKEFDVVKAETSVIEQEPNKANFKPEVITLITTKRKSKFYVTNYYAPLVFIELMAYGVFFVSDFSKRLSILMTVVLCIVAFAFTLNSRLPALSSSTRIHTFYHFGYVWMMCIGVYCLVNEQLVGVEHQSFWDKVAAWSLLGLWLLQKLFSVIQISCHS